MPQARHIDPHQLYDNLVKLGEDWADKDAAASMLEETKKSLLGKITDGNMVWSSSHAAAEKSALGSKEYVDHIRSTVKARQEAHKARVKYDAFKIYLELIRTEASTRREEIKHLGGLP